MSINSDQYFYHEATRKLITVFGALFNNIQTARKLSDDTLQNQTRVPLSYGPRSKFLSRLRENRTGSGAVSIKLPRMGFEISSLALDEGNKVNKGNRVKYCTDDQVSGSAYAAVPYKIGFTLSIFGRTQDDMFQIIEQIIPHFSPDYVVSIKDLEGPGTVMDVPFTLDSVNMSDEYEGDFQPARPLVYTLEFTARIKYLGSVSTMGLIEHSIVQILDTDDSSFYTKSIAKGEDNIITLCEVNQIDYKDKFEIILDTDDISAIEEGSEVFGETSGYSGFVDTKSGNNTLVVDQVDNLLTIGENLVDTTGNTYVILEMNYV